MKKSIFIIGCFLALMSSSAYAAGSSMAVTNVDTRDDMNLVKISWVADDTNASVPATAFTSYNGFVYGIMTDPGSTAPAADYDIDITHTATTTNFFSTTLNDRHTSTSQLVIPTTPVYIRDFTVTVTNVTNNSATGDIYLWMSPHSER